MDALVAQYSRPAFEDEGYSSDDQQSLSVTPTPCLKFALPPLSNVSITYLEEFHIVEMNLLTL